MFAASPSTPAIASTGVSQAANNNTDVDAAPSHPLDHPLPSEPIHSETHTEVQHQSSIHINPLSLDQHKVRILSETKNVSSFVVIGQTLHKLYYQDKLVKNQKEFLEWTKHNLGFSKSTTYEYIISYKVYSEIAMHLPECYRPPMYQSHCQLLSKVPEDSLVDTWIAVCDSAPNGIITTAFLETFLEEHCFKPKANDSLASSQKHLRSHSSALAAHAASSAAVPLSIASASDPDSHARDVVTATSLTAASSPLQKSSASISASISASASASSARKATAAASAAASADAIFVDHAALHLGSNTTLHHRGSHKRQSGPSTSQSSTSPRKSTIYGSNTHIPSSSSSLPRSKTSTKRKRASTAALNPAVMDTSVATSDRDVDLDTQFAIDGAVSSSQESVHTIDSSSSMVDSDTDTKDNHRRKPVKHKNRNHSDVASCVDVKDSSAGRLTSPGQPRSPFPTRRGVVAGGGGTPRSRRRFEVTAAVAVAAAAATAAAAAATAAAAAADQSDQLPGSRVLPSSSAAQRVSNSSRRRISNAVDRTPPKKRAKHSRPVSRQSTASQSQSHDPLLSQPLTQSSIQPHENDHGSSQTQSLSPPLNYYRDTYPTHLLQPSLSPTIAAAAAALSQSFRYDDSQDDLRHNMLAHAGHSPSHGLPLAGFGSYDMGSPGYGHKMELHGGGIGSSSTSSAVGLDAMARAASVLTNHSDTFMIDDDGVSSLHMRHLHTTHTPTTTTTDADTSFFSLMPSSSSTLPFNDVLIYELGKSVVLGQQFDICAHNSDEFRLIEQQAWYGRLWCNLATCLPYSTLTPTTPLSTVDHGGLERLLQIIFTKFANKEFVEGLFLIRGEFGADWFTPILQHPFCILRHLSGCGGDVGVPGAPVAPVPAVVVSDSGRVSAQATGCVDDVTASTVSTTTPIKDITTTTVSVDKDTVVSGIPTHKVDDAVTAADAAIQHERDVDDDGNTVSVLIEPVSQLSATAAVVAGDTTPVQSRRVSRLTTTLAVVDTMGDASSTRVMDSISALTPNVVLQPLQPPSSSTSTSTSTATTVPATTSTSNGFESYVVFYLGPNVKDFCSVFRSVGLVPGVNSWSAVTTTTMMMPVTSSVASRHGSCHTVMGDDTCDLYGSHCHGGGVCDGCGNGSGHVHGSRGLDATLAPEHVPTPIPSQSVRVIRGGQLGHDHDMSLGSTAMLRSDGFVQGGGGGGHGGFESHARNLFRVSANDVASASVSNTATTIPTTTTVTSGHGRVSSGLVNEAATALCDISRVQASVSPGRSGTGGSQPRLLHRLSTNVAESMSTAIPVTASVMTIAIPDAQNRRRASRE